MRGGGTKKRHSRKETGKLKLRRMTTYQLANVEKQEGKIGKEGGKESKKKILLDLEGEVLGERDH